MMHERRRKAYALAKRNDGSPGIDGVTFEAIKAGGVERFIGQIEVARIGWTVRRVLGGVSRWLSTRPSLSRSGGGKRG